MTRRVRRKSAKGPRKVVLSDQPETKNAGCLKMDEKGLVDWTRLPNDAVVDVFGRLSYRDRANMASSCKSWRSVGSSSCLWRSLDLRYHRCDWGIMHSLASRCSNLQKLRFRGSANTDSLINIRAKSLKELSGDNCRILTDSTLAVIAARHSLLDRIQLGPDGCEMITSASIVAIAFCCPKLKKLRLSGVPEVSYEAIRTLANHCPDLYDIGLIDCLYINEMSLANVVSLRFLSVAGTTNIDWNLANENWCSLPDLEGLDVSRTDVDPASVRRLLLSIDSLKLVCAFNCPSLEEDATVYNFHGKMTLGFSNDTFKVLSSMFPDTKEEHAIFSNWRNGSMKKDGNLDEFMTWVEWILSHALLRLAQANLTGRDQFWLDQGVDLFLNLLQSSQEDVQEWAAIGLANFVVASEGNIKVDVGRAEAVMNVGGVQLLLSLARSWKEGIQLEATKAIANLSVNPSFAKSVAGGGGITILASLAKSMNRFVAEEAAAGLWNLSVGDGHKRAIAEAGGIKALVDLIFKWHRDGYGVLQERVAGALANLAGDDKCSMEVAALGGINALVTLTRISRHAGVQEQAARALGNLTAHGGNNTNNATAGQEEGAIEALILLTRFPHDAVRQEAAGALWNLSLDERNREQIALDGGVEALVALAQSCTNGPSRLQKRAAGALWGLSVSAANSMEIGREGGVPALIALAQSKSEDVHETAAGALWNLAFNPENALRILENGGVSVLIYFCSSKSNMTRFMAALALSYLFDGRMDEHARVGSSDEGGSKSVTFEKSRLIALKYIKNFVWSFANPQGFCSAALSSAPALLALVTESARILEVGQLRCSRAELGRFVSMLRNESLVLKSCAAFALLQFTVPGGRHAPHHVNILQALGAPRVLRATAAATAHPIITKTFARCVLKNLEHHQTESSA